MKCYCDCGGDVVTEQVFDKHKYCVALCKNTFLPILMVKTTDDINKSKLPSWLMNLYGLKK